MRRFLDRRVQGQTHAEVPDEQAARAKHERHHASNPSLDWPIGSLTFENCPAWPCRTYRLGGLIHESWIDLLVHTQLIGIWTWRSRLLEAWDNR